MKKYNLSLLLLISLCAFSQSSKGVVEYTAQINPEHLQEFIIELKQNKDVPQHVKSEVIEMYQNAQPEQYTLVFLNNESFFKHERILNVDDAYNMGSKAGTSSFYTNDTQIVEYNILGYVLKEPLKWNITKETRKIGDFTCFKATATELLMSRKGYIYEKEIEAWFTAEIAVQFGPQNYSGLPGLVVELIRDEFTIKATNINLNPEENIKIKPPKQNKIITQEQANSLIKERSKRN